MTKKKQDKLIDMMRRNSSVTLPYKVMCVFGMKSIDVCGDQVAFSHDTDFVREYEMREAIEWLADQFNGKVRWK